MGVQIVRIGATLPDDLDQLTAAARAEGFGFLDRLSARWIDGAYHDGEHAPDTDATAFAGYVDGELRAIGAQTLDSLDPDPRHRRMRHVYVRTDARRAGVGRALAGALIQEGFDLAPRLHLRATYDLSRAFWDAMGFSRTDHPTRTHELVR